MSTPNPSALPDFPSKAAWLQNRFEAFGAAVTTLSEKLPKSPAGNHYGRQMLRSATAAAPNYGEARSAESRADFIHKMRIVLKELNETASWIRMAVRAKLISAEMTTEILAENTELCRISAKSITTARGSLNEK